MKRTLLGLFALTLLVAWVAPSFAIDHKVNGYFRARFMRYDWSFQDLDPVTVVDQRFRAKWDMGLNEYVSLTYYGEVDMQYGDASYGRGNSTRNQGGALGGDTVSMETKNLYASVKIPETPISSKIGLQGYGDGVEGVLFAADMAGVRFDGNFDMFKLVFGWFKWDENSAGGDNSEDDIDLWALKVRVNPMENLKLGGDVMWLNVNGPGTQLLGNNLSGSTDADLYYVTLDAEYSMPDLNGLFLRGWFIYNGGEFSDFNTDVAGFAVSGQVGAKFGGFSIRGRVMYWGGDDDLTDGDFDAIVQPALGETFFLYKDNLQLSVADVYGNTVFQNGFVQAATGLGLGLWGVTVAGEFMPPAMPKAYLKYGLAYWSATEAEDQGFQDDELGFEISLRAGYKIADIVDLSLNGAYFAAGDFFQPGPTGSTEDTWQLYAMVNIPY